MEDLKSSKSLLMAAELKGTFYVVLELCLSLQLSVKYFSRFGCALGN